MRIAPLAAMALLAASALTARAARKPAAKAAAVRRWSATGSFERGRYYAALVKLRDGRVLLTGGLIEGMSTGLSDASLYDPATGRWTAAAPMHEGRFQHGAVVLADGRVLVTGGQGPDGRVVGTAEIFDPARDLWSRAASMAQTRKAHAAAPLPGGRVLVAGGYDGARGVTGSEIYDPAADSWTPAGKMLAPRVFPGVSALRDGRLLISGGRDQTVFSSAEIFDPATNAWKATGNMSRPRAEHGSAVLPDGRVIVAAGIGAAGSTNSAEIYDPASGTWTPTPSLSYSRRAVSMVLAGRTPLVIGGEDETTDHATTEFFDAATNAWRPGPRLAGGRTWLGAVTLDDGRVLAASGRRGLRGGTGLNSAEVLSASGEFGPSEPEGGRAPAPELPRVPPPVSSPARVAESGALPAAVAPRPNAHAVIIGIERYRETLPRADFAARDARLTAEYFRRVLGVPEENMAVLTDDRATKGDFEKHFERWLPNRVEPGDEVFVYFSGHGAPNPKTGASYLVPFDADPTYIDQTGYPLARLYAQLAKLKARRVLVALDSCFSGSGGRSVIAKGARPLVAVVSSEVPRPLVVISASAGDQISNTYQKKGHGLFTYFFLEGLKKNGDDLRASFDYLKPNVSRVARREYNSDQDPQWREGR